VEVVIMPRRRPKIPLATAVGPRPKASLKIADWERIERAYGRALPLPARAAVLKITDEYLGVAMFEPTAEPIRDTAKRLKQVQRGAQLLMQALAKCDESSATAVYATRLIERHATDPLLPKHGKVRFILLLTSGIAAASAKAVGDLNEEAAKDHFRSGEPWDSWMRRLTKILQEHDLPSAVPKDSDKWTHDVPFAALVRELQKCVPPQFRRHTHSEGALEQAIYRARRPAATIAPYAGAAGHKTRRAAPNKSRPRVRA
jgi:hypothetical protein